jgi:hypothetical protein
MAKRFFLLLPAALLATAMLSSCGGGAEVLVIPLFEFIFVGNTPDNSQSIQASFAPNKPTTSSGNFDLVNLDAFANGGGHSSGATYGGTYSGCTFKLSVRADSTATAPFAASYDGRFTSNDVVELTPTSGTGLPTLKLTRSPLSQTKSGC